MKRIVLPLAVGTCVLLAAAARAALGPPVELPSAWHLAPADASAALGTMPEGIVLSHDEKRAFIVEGGYNAPGVRIVDTTGTAPERFVPLKDAFGRPLLDRDGDGVWVAGASADALFHIDTKKGAVDRTIALPAGFYPNSVDRSPNGTELAASGDAANAVVLVDAASGKVGNVIEVGDHPSDVLFAGTTLYVTSWSKKEIDAIDVPTQRVRAQITVGLHPESLASANGRLYVADADDDALSVVDEANDREIARTSVGLTDPGVTGASPNAVRVSNDGMRVYVTCGAANALVAFAPSADGVRRLGAVPTGWYPTDVAVAKDALYVIDGKGESSHANPQLNPLAPGAAGHIGYIAANLVGSLRRMAMPSEADLAAGVSTVRQLERTAAVNGTATVRAHGPIKHVLYIIKENRTYDQVLGDLPGANGDPKLAMFGSRVTPNEHAIEQRFGVFDNYYTDSHVSADGHNWSMAAFANDYLEKYWPANYAGRRKLYDFEDGATGSVPHNGYLWNLAARSHVSYRNYGEFTTQPKTAGGDWTTVMPGLSAVTDPHAPGFDLKTPDRVRYEEWAREYAAYEKSGLLPQLVVLRLPNDHTSGTRVGMPTPQAMVAENDVAVGRVVETVSHSRDWMSTAIFIIEDDAQNGPDHVDEQRSTLYVVSPYAAGGVHHEHYTQAGVVRTIEMLLGMPPLTPYDEQAAPLAAAFVTDPAGQLANAAPYTALPAQIDLNAVNTAQSYRARDSGKLDFRRADAAPEDELNDIIRGATRTAAR